MDSITVPIRGVNVIYRRMDLGGLIGGWDWIVRLECSELSIKLKPPSPNMGKVALKLNKSILLCGGTFEGITSLTPVFQTAGISADILITRRF